MNAPLVVNNTNIGEMEDIHSKNYPDQFYFGDKINATLQSNKLVKINLQTQSMATKKDIAAMARVISSV